MLWIYIGLLIALVAGAAAALQLQTETGYVLLSYGPWVVETSLLGFCAALAVALLLLYSALKLLRTGLGLPARWRRAAARRRAETARDSFELGLLKLFEGQWKRAEIELIRRAADHHAGHLNYLAAARAAQRVGAPERRDRYLALVREHSPHLAFALGLTQAELQRERGEFARMRDTALALRAKEPQHPYAIELLADAQEALADWPALRLLLADEASRKALGGSRWRELSSHAAVAVLDRAVTDHQLDTLNGAWAATPESVRGELEVVRAYARGLARLNADASARGLIERTLDRQWDEALVRLYGPLHTDDPIAQLAKLERWLQLHGEQPALLETAGRVCIKNKLWGKARSYLEAVIARAPTTAAYQQLARLCELTQAPEEAQRFYREGLALAVAQDAAVAGGPATEAPGMPTTIAVLDTLNAPPGA